jgi:tetratricopeptide (TPR) repeat protein
MSITRDVRSGVERPPGSADEERTAVARRPHSASGCFLAWLRKKSYDRSRSLAQAARARARGNRTKAISRYREVLAHEPTNTDIHRRLAPLLAGTKQTAEAWESYRIAVASLMRGGFVDRAVGVLREAAGCLGKERCVWEELAQAEQERGRPVDAHEALLEGRRHFRARGERSEAIRLLLRARKLAPNHFEGNYDLARLLARSGAAGPAAHILAELADRSEGSALRRVRLRQLLLTPSPGALWRWLRAWVGLR